jgi:hypothetical protein
MIAVGHTSCSIIPNLSTPTPNSMNDTFHFPASRAFPLSTGFAWVGPASGDFSSLTLTWNSSLICASTPCSRAFGLSNVGFVYWIYKYYIFLKFEMLCGYPDDCLKQFLGQRKMLEQGVNLAGESLE